MTVTTTSNDTEKYGKRRNFDDPFQISRPTEELLTHATDDQPNPKTQLK